MIPRDPREERPAGTSILPLASRAGRGCIPAVSHPVPVVICAAAPGHPNALLLSIPVQSLLYPPSSPRLIQFPFLSKKHVPVPASRSVLAGAVPPLGFFWAPSDWR